MYAVLTTHISLCMAAALVFSGCTTAHITSSPSGADVFLSTRGVVEQAVWEKHCTTPCSIRLGSSFHTVKVQWPDNVESNTQDFDTAFPLFQTLAFHFAKPNLPVEQPKHIEWFAPVPLSILSGPEACQE